MGVSATTLVQSRHLGKQLAIGKNTTFQVRFKTPTLQDMKVGKYLFAFLAVSDHLYI